MKKFAIPPAMVSQFAAMPPISGIDDIACWNGPCWTRLPEFLESRHPVGWIVAGDEAGVDRADRGADHPVRLDAGLMQRLVDADLVGTQRAATLQHQHDLAETGGNSTLWELSRRAFVQGVVSSDVSRW